MFMTLKCNYQLVVYYLKEYRGLNAQQKGMLHLRFIDLFDGENVKL